MNPVRNHNRNRNRNRFFGSSFERAFLKRRASKESLVSVLTFQRFNVLTLQRFNASTL